MELPFHSLKFAFGESFLQRFRGSFVSSANSETDILDHVILVDTPGTLDGSGEDRNYNFSEVMGWFAKRAALIIIFFDVNKMGVSTEMKSVLDNIQGNEEKIKIVFNKADTVDERDLAGSLAGNSVLYSDPSKMDSIDMFWFCFLSYREGPHFFTPLLVPSEMLMFVSPSRSSLSRALNLCLSGSDLLSAPDTLSEYAICEG